MSEFRYAAASIVLSDDAKPRIMLVRRNPELRFMGGHHAFPGGSIGEEDREAAQVLGLGEADEIAAIHAAAREVFEETGLLLSEGPLPDLDKVKAARIDVLNDERPFLDVLGEFGHKLNPERFVDAGLWVTPKFSPIRFHTRYFMVRHEGPSYDEVIEGEIVGVDWFTAQEARRHWRAGDIRISTPIAYVLQHLARMPLPEVLEPLRRTSVRETGDPARFEMRCGIHLLPLITPTLPPAQFTNCIVVGEDDLYIIDPGCHDEREQDHLIEHIDRLIAIGGKPAAIVLTHSHVDHVGGAQRLREHYGIPLWAHRATDDQLDFRIDRHIEDNEVIEVPGQPSWRLRAVHTPGHDPGHLAFIEETTRSLIGGDMIANPGTIVISQEYGGDMTEYLASIDRLLEEEFNIIYPSHGMPITKPKDRLQELKAHRLEREAKVKAALEEGHRSIEELLPVVYADTPKEAWPLATHSLRAHLARLGVDLD